MPKISAVMALYNTPYDLLKITVESILNQTFDNFELIIVDDASTNKYKDFFDNYNDKRIKYLKLKQNAGPGHARNEGIKKASGEYIAIVDSDDVYLPNRFEAQADFLDKNPEISLISCAFKQSNNGKIPPVIEKDEDIKIEMLFNSQLANPAVMFRKNIFVQNNLFYPESINFGEDYELWLNAMFEGIKMANLDEILMIYTRRSGQLSKEKEDKQISILKNLYRKIFAQLKMDVSHNEINLHYNINCKNFKSINSPDEISRWFDKIIEGNKTLHIFNEKKLLNKKNQVVKDFVYSKNRIFKIKIGQNNFCIYKPFKFSIEKRD